MQIRSNISLISYRSMTLGDEAGVVDLVLRIFSEFVAPQFSQEGIAEFKKFVSADALADRLRTGNIFLIAESGKEIIGVIEMRENSHIALLFVEKSRQRRGIAKELVRKSIEICRNRNPEIQKITVNSSPNAFIAYQKIGFVSVENEKIKDGIRFIPMELILDNGSDSQPANSADPKGRAVANRSYSDFCPREGGKRRYSLGFRVNATTL